MPKVSLAIDNCFASKRWTRPDEWARLARDTGVTCIEQSADTECDPLYGGTAYLERWADEVREAEAKHGVEVVNLYSGHGTYSTLGLTHTDVEVQERMLRQWVFPLIATAESIGAGVGFFCHAFPQSALATAESYEAAVETLLGRLSEIASFASDRLARPIGVEQMYVPHQYPWRISDASRILSTVYERTGGAMYTLLDVGHASGQHRFLDPGALGSHLVATESDTDPYEWIRRLAPWSPIIHLQQTDGRSSPHRGFSVNGDADGVITGEQVLASLAEAFSSEPPPGMPPQAEHIYLTIEVFAHTSDLPAEILSAIGSSVEYWRRYIPEDGVELSEVVEAYV